MQRTSEIISSVLEVVYPDDPGYLWTELQTSTTVNKILGDETVWPPSDRSYLATLAEAYNVKAWDTRKQVSSIMVGIASYKALLAFIPGLTPYRFLYLKTLESTSICLFLHPLLGFCGNVLCPSRRKED